jgi:hypothetical protein
MNYNLVPEITQEIWNKAIDIYCITTFGGIPKTYITAGYYSAYREFRNCNGTWNLGMMDEGIRIGIMGWEHTKLGMLFDKCRYGKGSCPLMGFYIYPNCGSEDPKRLRYIKRECFKIMKAFIGAGIPLIVPNGSYYYSGFKKFLDKKGT